MHGIGSVIPVPAYFCATFEINHHNPSGSLGIQLYRHGKVVLMQILIPRNVKCQADNCRYSPGEEGQSFVYVCDDLCVCI